MTGDRIYDGDTMLGEWYDNGNEIAGPKIVAALNRKSHEDQMLAALEAIRARINGVWDHQSLVAYGPLSTETRDILRIADAAIAAVNP